MLNLLVTLITGNVGANLRRFGRLAMWAAATLVFASVALIAAGAAAFLALERAVGAIGAALIVAGGAAVAAVIAAIPLWWKPKPPPPSAAATLVELAVAVGLGLIAERRAKLQVWT